MVGKDKKGLMNEVKVDKGYFVKRVIAMALLMAPAMLVVPPLVVAPMMLFIPPLFAVACTLENKLKKNKNERALSQIKDRFGDVLIGIISGLIASYFMWVLLTFDEISISLLFLVFPMLIASLAVAYTMVIVWVSFTTK